MTAMHSSLSSINVNKKKLELASYNVANVDTKGYARKEVIQEAALSGNHIQGVTITGLTTKTDQNLERELLNKISEASYSNIKKQYFEAMNFELGTPGGNNSIDTYITGLFKELNNLSLHPDSPSQKVITIDRLTKTADKIATLAKSLEDLRYSADMQLSNISTSINAELKNAYFLNHQTNSLPKGTMEHIESVEKLKAGIQNLAEFFELRQFTDKAGNLNVLTSNGISLISPDTMYQTKYTPVPSVDDLIADAPLNGFYMTAVDESGNDLNLNLVIAPQGKSRELGYQLGPGKISALLEMRDKEIPHVLNQLDNLAKKIKDEFNKVHNTGTGYPPATELTGTKLVSLNETLKFSGSVRIAIVDDNGSPISVPDIPPLTLNLSKLDTGDGAGQPNLQGILKEINYHFSDKLTVNKRAEIGNLRDVKLAAFSSVITPSSTFTLDLELSNYSGKDSAITITSVTATDNIGGNILSSFNNTTHNIASGTTERTGASGPSVVLNNTAAPLEYPYTITVDYQVVENLTTYTASVTYTIDNPAVDVFNGVKNTRFSATAVAGDATLVLPKVDYNVLSATLVDDQGNPIASNSADKGRVKITSTESNYHIVIDQLDSQYLGDPTNNVFATNEGFTALLGLNDLFVRTDEPKNWGNTRNSAVFLALRDDIQTDPNRLSTGKLRQSMQSPFPDAPPIYTYEVSSGDNEALIDMTKLRDQQFFFAKASGLPAATLSFASYATEVLSYNSVKTSHAIHEADRNGLFKDALQEKLESIRGVDLNTELANLILYQQAFAASAKTMEISRQFFDTMINSF